MEATTAWCLAYAVRMRWAQTGSDCCARAFSAQGCYSCAPLATTSGRAKRRLRQGQTCRVWYVRVRVRRMAN